MTSRTPHPYLNCRHGRIGVHSSRNNWACTALYIKCHFICLMRRNSRKRPQPDFEVKSAPNQPLASWWCSPRPSSQLGLRKEYPVSSFPLVTSRFWVIPLSHTFQHPCTPYSENTNDAIRSDWNPVILSPRCLCSMQLLRGGVSITNVRKKWSLAGPVTTRC